MLKITKGTQVKPIKSVIYGHEGIGKSTLASKLPGAVFIDIEQGTNQLDVARLPRPRTWTELLSEIADVISNDYGIETLVIDTADAAEQLCIAHVCAGAGKKSIEEWGYGKGYALVRDEFLKLIGLLDELTTHGVNVCILAHACISRVETPEESASYDRWTLKLIDTKRTSDAALLKEWADLLLFIDYDTYVEVNENGRGKAKGGKRVIKCTHSATYDAKNRYDLPDEIPLNESACIVDIFENSSAKGRKRAQERKEKEKALGVDEYPESASVKRLKEHMLKDSITDAQLRAIVAGTGKYKESAKVSEYEPAFIEYISAHWADIAKKASKKANVQTKE